MSFFQSASTRRRFLGRLGLAGLASTAPAARLLRAASSKSTSPPAVPPKPVVRNRAPLAPSAFYMLPLGSIQPTGWLRDQLEIQANGLSGHLDETWPDVGPNSGWLGGTGESWERGPYFLDGLLPLAWLLDSPRLKAKAQKRIDWTLNHPAPDGMFGPASNNDWWPRIVMLKALTQYQELTGDPRVIPLMEHYFRHQLAALPTRPLRDWGKFRWQDEALSVLWLYNRTGQPWLLDLTRLLHQQGHDWEAEYASFQFTRTITAAYLKLDQGNGLADLSLSTHGVNNAMALKTGAVWSLVSRDPADRNAARHMLAELDKYHGLPNGMFSCDEHLAGLDPTHGSELCSVVETMFSLEHALAITGDPAFGDRLERLAFNALPGTFNDTMWAHQYNQEPNQVECSLHQKPWVTDGPESNLYGLEPNFGCCTANFHQGWPKFTNSLWMLSTSGTPGASGEPDGLVAAAYAPCRVHTLVNRTPVHIAVDTEYPFRGLVRIAVSPAAPLRFPLRLRIPSWAAGTEILVNGQRQPELTPGTFVRIQREWHPNDRVEIRFPMAPRVSHWFHESVAVERGPLVFSYGIGESWVKLRDRGLTADWQVFPSTPWNYALAVNPDTPEKSITASESPLTASPFARRAASVRLRVKARQLDAWRATDGATDPLPPSPVTSANPEQTIDLIPYAAAKLRITAFPLLKT